MLSFILLAVKIVNESCFYKNVNESSTEIPL